MDGFSGGHRSADDLSSLRSRAPLSSGRRCHGQNPKARINNEPKEPTGYDPNAVNNPSTAYMSLSSPWVIAIGTLLGLVLIFNIIFMCYINCNREKGRVLFERRKGYSSIKRVDSDDFDESEANPINVVSE